MLVEFQKATCIRTIINNANNSDLEPHPLFSEGQCLACKSTRSTSVWSVVFQILKQGKNFVFLRYIAQLKINFKVPYFTLGYLALILLTLIIHHHL
jgi:hypothetical protein